jgi:hypothetical protein
MGIGNEMDQGFGDLGSGFDNIGSENGIRDDEADFDMNVDEGVENDNRQDFGFNDMLDQNSASVIPSQESDRKSQIEMEQESARLRKQEIERRKNELIKQQEEQEAQLQAKLA